MKDELTDCALGGSHQGVIKRVEVTADGEVIASAMLCEAHIGQQSFSGWTGFDARGNVKIRVNRRRFSSNIDNPMSEEEFQELIFQLDKISRLTGARNAGPTLREPVEGK